MQSFASIGTGWFSFIILGGVIAAIVQIMFAWRLWILVGSRVLSVSVALLAITQACAAFAGGIQLKFASGTQNQDRAALPLTIWLMGSALVDIMIAASMVVLLQGSKYRQRKLGANEVVVNRLILFFIETGALTATVALVTLILFLITPITLLHECPAIVLAKLYSNTMLAGFNNRIVVKRTGPAHLLPFDLTRSPMTATHVSPASLPHMVSPGLLRLGSRHIPDTSGVEEREVYAITFPNYMADPELGLEEKQFK